MRIAVTKWIALSFIFLVSPFVANGTTLRQMSLRDLTASAESIIRARFVSADTKWERGSIWTFASFSVLETFKGKPLTSVLVRIAGGRVGHLETHVDGGPSFAAGDEAVLFLERTSVGDYGITSWSQGTFRVHRRARSEPTVTQDTSRLALFNPLTGRLTQGSARELPLSEFLAEIAAALSVHGARP